MTFAYRIKTQTDFNILKYRNNNRQKNARNKEFGIIIQKIQYFYKQAICSLNVNRANVLKITIVFRELLAILLYS